MFQPDDEFDGVLIDTICVGCDSPLPVNDLGLCADCFAKLERDLIRQRDWDHSATAFLVAEDQREALRERIIREYGAALELIAPDDIQKPKRKNKRSHSRNTQHKQEIAAKAIREYTTEDVLQAVRSFLQTQADEWVNASRLEQHLYERFHKLKPKHLGEPGKKYKSLLKFISDHPADFEVRQDDEKRGLHWIRLTVSYR
ncbi:MAG: OST-HTH/LOTUS domain-containing protein [bacterium]|nr:OST-HTH/LOTUS domain-containing protein [bacterium]